MKVLGILQARMTSSRFPGKVMMPLLGEPMLVRQIERVVRSQKMEKLVVATSVDSSDDPIVDLCRKIDVDCFRGSLNDVLDRYYQAAAKFGAAQVVRLTGDCPLADPDVVDRVIDSHLRDGNAYTSNCNPPTYPDGLDVEVITMAALTRAWKEARLPSEREHVTAFVRNHPSEFKIGNVVHDKDLSDMRWTVDRPDDFEFVSRIYAALFPERKNFSINDVLAYLDKNPSIKMINSKNQRNEGYAKSLAEDRRAAPNEN